VCVCVCVCVTELACSVFTDRGYLVIACDSRACSSSLRQTLETLVTDACGPVCWHRGLTYTTRGPMNLLPLIMQTVPGNCTTICPHRRPPRVRRISRAITIRISTISNSYFLDFHLFYEYKNETECLYAKRKLLA